MRERGRLERVIGTAVELQSAVAHPAAHRQPGHQPAGTREHRCRYSPACARAASAPGAGLFLALEYSNGRGGVGVLGRKGMPSEVVAEQAVTELLAFHDSGAAVDRHLADQLDAAAGAVCRGQRVTVEAITSHLLTNIAVVRAFLNRPIDGGRARASLSRLDNRNS